MGKNIVIDRPYPLDRWSGRDQMRFGELTGVEYTRLPSLMRGMNEDNLPPSKVVYGLIFIAAHHCDPTTTWDDVLDVPFADAMQLIQPATAGESLPPPQPPSASVG